MSRTHLSIFISMCKPSLCSLSSSQTQSIDVQNKFHSQLTIFHSLCLSLPLSISILLYLYLYISHLLSLYLYYCISLSYYPSLSHSLIFPSLSPSVTLFLPLVSISLSHSLSLSSVTLFLPLSLSLCTHSSSQRHVLHAQQSTHVHSVTICVQDIFTKSQKSTDTLEAEEDGPIMESIRVG